MLLLVVVIETNLCTKCSKATEPFKTTIIINTRNRKGIPTLTNFSLAVLGNIIKVIKKLSPIPNQAPLLKLKRKEKIVGIATNNKV